MSHDKVWPEYPHECGSQEQSSKKGAVGRSADSFEQILKSSDDVALPESGVYFDALEARIMGALDAAIEAGEIENREKPQRAPVAMPVPAAVVAAQTKKRGRSIAMRAGQFALLVGVALLTSGKTNIAAIVENLIPDSILVGEDADEPMIASRGAAGEQLRATREAAPKVLTDSVIGFENESDLAIEIAARRMVAYHKGK